MLNLQKCEVCNNAEAEHTCILTGRKICSSCCAHSTDYHSYLYPHIALDTFNWLRRTLDIKDIHREFTRSWRTLQALAFKRSTKLK